MYVQRRIAGLAQILDACSGLAQCLDQIADWPLVHARHARQTIFAAAQCQCRGQRPERGAGVAEKQLGRLDRKRAARAGHYGRTAVLPHGDAERVQGVLHHARIRRSRAGRAGASRRGQGREQQHAIGNAFDPGSLTVPQTLRMGPRSR